MPLYAISDLHLSFHNPKPMTPFGNVWDNHPEKLARNWRAAVTDGDTVLVPGDISWAMNESEAEPDLSFIDALPGRKVLCSGNHDYWWGSASRLNGMYENMTFIKNTHAAYENAAICGSRGWLCPNDFQFTLHDDKLYKRELGRVKMSLESAVKAGFQTIILMLHYPPTNEKKEPSGFTELIASYPVTHVIYGHLHGKRAFGNSITGKRGGVSYALVSADYLEFMPKRIL